MEAYERTNPVAGAGWARNPNPALLAWGITERVDDYCATAFVYCREPQPVPRLLGVECLREQPPAARAHHGHGGGSG